MDKAITTLPGLVDSIMAQIELLKASDDKATRDTAAKLDTQTSDLIERSMRTIKLARNQRTTARVEQAELLAAIERLYPGFARTALLIAAMPSDEREAV